MNQSCKLHEDLGYNAVLTRFSSKTGFELPEIVRNRDVDGIIILGDAEEQGIYKIAEHGIPLVLVDAHQSIKNIVSVEADYFSGAGMAMNHLIGCGHSRIAYIGETASSRYGKQTLNAYTGAMEKAGLAVLPSLICTEAEHAEVESGYTCMNRIFDTGQIPTAVFCAADVYAIGAMKAAKKRGHRVPEGISFIGMDNIL